MRYRCLNAASRQFPDYGGRGITICERWTDVETVLADIGPRPSLAYTLERKDNDGPYSPEHCAWATGREQGANTRNSRLVTYTGETRHVAEWARRLGISDSALICRLDKWPIERAMTEPGRDH